MEFNKILDDILKSLDDTLTQCESKIKQSMETTAHQALIETYGRTLPPVIHNLKHYN